MKKLQDGFTLVEIMIVVAILGVTAAMVIPNGVKMKMFEFYNAEQLEMNNIGKSLEAYVDMNRDIPNETNWATLIAKNIDASPSKITTNIINNQRLYVYPDNFLSIGTSLPYNQNTNIGAGAYQTTLPLNPRVMIISNLGKNALTSVSGMLASATFDNVWNQTGAYPAELTESDNIIIKRVNFLNSFKKITINNNDPITPSAYTVDLLPVATTPIASMASSIFYILKGSQIELYDTTPAIYYRGVVNQSQSFVFNTLWGGSLGAIGGGAASNATAAGGGPILQAASAFSTGGTLTNWVQSPTCSPTGTNYTLTVDNQNPNGDLNVFSGYTTGVMTFVGKVKKQTVINYGIPECAMVAIVPQDPSSTSLNIFYMPHNNFTVVAN